MATAIAATEPIQLPCRKQGIFEQGHWSARILTIDAANGTIAVSRKNKPSVVFHHALEVKKVQMWPHFSKEHIVGNFNSLRKSQLVLRIVGVEIPTSRMRPGVVGNAAAIVQQYRSAFAPAPPAAAAGGGRDMSSSDAEELPASPTRDVEVHNSATYKPAKGRQVYWMLRFERLVSYEAAVLALMSMKRPDGLPLNAFTSSNPTGDLNRIRKAYETHQGTAAAAAADTTKAAAPAAPAAAKAAN
jgi:hypothetical protein